METSQNKCVCENPPFHFQNYDITSWGTDETNGRYAEITLEKCKTCNKLWVKYLYENEGFSHSGKWFRGLIDENTVKTLTPETTISYIESLEWYFYGGSFFESTGKIGKGKINVD